MKTKIIIAALFLFSWQHLSAQSIAYEYDDNGNRISRTLIVQRLQSNTVNFPVKSPRSLVTFKSTNTEESIKTKESAPEEIKSEEEEIKPLVYPNPTRGILRIDVQKMPENFRNEVRVYDLNGNEMLFVKDFENNSEIDISPYQDGTYILRISVNTLLFYFKVIKTH